MINSLKPILLITVLLSLVSCSSKTLSPQQHKTTHKIKTSSLWVTTQSQKVSEWFEKNRHRPPKMRAFLQKMPKGADIHTHASGAVYAENYLKWAEQENRCVNIETGVISDDNFQPCALKNEISMESLVKNPKLYGNLVDKLSLRNVENSGESGHDQFFAAFEKFDFAGDRKADMIAELTNRLAKQNVLYTEIMLSVGKTFTKRYAKKVTFSGDIDNTYQQLIKVGLTQHIAEGGQELSHHETKTEKILRCHSAQAEAGCSITRRYLLQINRNKSPARVLSQMVYAFEIVKANPLAVGLNMVSPEDYLVALKDYDLQMKMLQYLGKKYPTVSISLHAGELKLGLVAPKYLRNHIRQAVEVAGAKRIGHGVDIFNEDNPFQLLQVMKAKNILVEICLSSNDAILGIKGKDHPFPDYLEAGVATTLASDDEGISRIDLTHEYQRAAASYELTYDDLKTLSRNSLSYAFLAGENLWGDNGQKPKLHLACAQDSLGSEQVSTECQRFLQANNKAKLQWQLEKRFLEFENSIWFR